MRGKRFAALKLLLVPACLLGAGLAAAQDTPPLPDASPSGPAAPLTVLVVDSSKTMGEKIGDTAKLDTVRKELGTAVAQYRGQFTFGLVAFGHRKTSNCADTEVLAKPGALDANSYEKLLGGLEAKGQAPLAAAMSEAAGLAASGQPIDVVLIADSGDTCDADICLTADGLKQKAKDLRVHVVGLNEEREALQPLACLAAATGGTFVATTSPGEFEQGLDAVFSSIASRTGGGDIALSEIDNQDAPLMMRDSETPGETAVFKSGGGSSAQSVVQRVAPPPQAVPDGPVPVTFKALVTEVGPKLQSGITWRIYDAKPAPDGRYKLVSTHREPNPTAALPPGEYLVNAAYGLSNLTKKIKVEGGRSVEEKFVLNTGGLALRGVLADGSPCPEGSVRFDIMSDEVDQFGKRETILADAKPMTVIRLNAGAYHVVSLYGDANASVGVDVTVEPGRVTEATIKHNGAKITFRLVQHLGGEALANTKWRILTSAGDTVKANAGALPTHTLAPGSYAVVADHNGASYTRKFSIEPGEDKQIEVAIDDGPTSPEALKALLDPPEPPTPGAGTLAGDGEGGSALGFDGFSARPANPNGPLINPGTLFRPSAP